MKKTLVTIALLLSAAATLLQAQKINTWKGGFPGQESNWSCPRNWSLGTVPDWACQVVIPQQTSDRKNYPVLTSKNEEIYSLFIQPGARLEIAPSGELTVLELDSQLTAAAGDGNLFVSRTPRKPGIRE